MAKRNTKANAPSKPHPGFRPLRGAHKKAAEQSLRDCAAQMKVPDMELAALIAHYGWAADAAFTIERFNHLRAAFRGAPMGKGGPR